MTTPPRPTGPGGESCARTWPAAVGVLTSTGPPPHPARAGESAGGTASATSGPAGRLPISSPQMESRMGGALVEPSPVPNSQRLRARAAVAPGQRGWRKVDHHGRVAWEAVYALERAIARGAPAARCCPAKRWKPTSEFRRHVSALRASATPTRTRSGWMWKRVSACWLARSVALGRASVTR